MPFVACGQADGIARTKANRERGTTMEDTTFRTARIFAETVPLVLAFVDQLARWEAR